VPPGCWPWALVGAPPTSRAELSRAVRHLRGPHSFVMRNAGGVCEEASGGGSGGSGGGGGIGGGGSGGGGSGSGSAAHGGTRLVLLERRSNRRFLNRERLLGMASRLGYAARALYLEGRSLRSQLEVFACHQGALVAMHGSGLVWALFVEDGTRVLEVEPYRYPTGLWANCGYSTLWRVGHDHTCFRVRNASHAIAAPAKSTSATRANAHKWADQWLDEDVFQQWLLASPPAGERGGRGEDARSARERRTR
jgi:hypothetical protein